MNFDVKTDKVDDGTYVISLAGEAAAAIDDQQFNELKDLVTKQGQKIEKQDQRIEQLEKNHAQDGQVHVQTSCPVIGQGSHTTLAQVAAHALGIDPDSIVVEQTDTAVVGPGTGSFMSRGSVTAATSVFRAATLLRELQAENGELDVTVSYDPPQAAHPYATHMCMVEVDAETGEAKILRYVVAEDCGVLINPMIVEGQVTGGGAQGAGAALMEEVAYGGDGQLLSSTFVDYLVPSVGETPEVEIAHLVTPSTVHELGTKGAGEGGTIGSTPAIANAVADALSLADLTLPLTPDRLTALRNDA